MDSLDLDNTMEETQVLRQLEGDDDTIIPSFAASPTTLLSDNPQTMIPPSRRSSADETPDTSEEVLYPKSIYNVGDFQMALGLWIVEAGITGDDYVSLLEVLGQMKSLTEIGNLPKTMRTLKHNVKGQLPLMKLRRKQIPVEPMKLPTGNPRADAPMAWMYWFDSFDLIKTLLSTDQFRSRLHIGMGHFVEKSSELWHSPSWITSIRASSGEFARYPNMTPILPSDVVYHRCLRPRCTCQTTPHLGRVYAVAKDFSSALVDGIIKIKVQPLLRRNEISEHEDLVKVLNEPLNPKEALYIEDIFYYLSESDIESREPNVCLDYLFESQIPESQDEIDAGGRSRFRSNIGRWDTYLVRRVLNTKQQKIRPLCQSIPLRGELEIATYGRQYLIESFGSSAISLPMLCFIDGFGLYRNMYRTLLGIYLICAGLRTQEQSRRMNVLPLTLGPHGSDFSDVVSALSPSLSRLDEGVNLNINGVDTFVCAYIMCYIGDTPQQQVNAGFKSHNADYGCRNCLAFQEDLGNLDYDIVSKGRYHHQTLELRQRMIKLKTKKAREDFAQDWGLADEQTPLIKLSPGLDLVLTRPPDPAHSEYAGMSKQAHNLLMEAILTTEGKREYTKALQRFKFPTGWGRLQSPLHHLDSFRMQEHARASIIIPLLLRQNMSKAWVKPHFLVACQVIFREWLAQHSSRNAIETIVAAYVAMARSNTILSSRSLSSHDLSKMNALIKDSRQQYANLCTAASQAILNAATETTRKKALKETAPKRTPRSRAKAPARSADPSDPPSSLQRRGSVSSVSSGESQSSQALTIPEFEEPIDASVRSKKRQRKRKIKNPEDAAIEQSASWLKRMCRPNVHVGLHYEKIATEYGTPYACNTLAGEMAHK